MTPAELRRMVARGEYTKPTAGQCPGFVQANLAAFPSKYADDFERFCQANPKPCPLLEVVGPGTPISQILAPGADLRDTIPYYQIWQDGRCTATVESLHHLQTEDYVFFLLGCSFSFEEALIKAGIPLRHISEGKNVAMYKTTLPLVQAGPFQGSMVVSMRPIPSELVSKAASITSRYPRVHGGPIHFGEAEAIGITNLQKPDFGDPIEIKRDETPVFWACGVTPQNVVQQARLPQAISHAPGFMFVSDLRNSSFAQDG
jgi:uncharacterized protein YcsI (UPF0317 family)